MFSIDSMRDRESEAVPKREPERTESITGLVVDFDIDSRVRRIAKIDTQGSPERTVTGIADQADIGSHRAEVGTTPQSVASFSSNTDIGRFSIAQRHETCVEIQRESAPLTRSETNAAPEAPGIMLVIAETERALGVPDHREAWIKNAFDGHGAFGLQLTALGTIPGQVFVGD